jgi:hypothetical protein
MSKMLLALTFVATASGALATRLMWTLLADPITMAAALESGSPITILAVLLGAR